MTNQQWRDRLHARVQQRLAANENDAVAALREVLAAMDADPSADGYEVIKREMDARIDRAAELFIGAAGGEAVAISNGADALAAVLAE